MKRLRLIVFCCILFFGWTTLVKGEKTEDDDPCVFESGVYYPSARVYGCWNTIPFNKTVRDQTLDVLQAAYQLFVFLDIARDPPDPYHFNPPVDLLAEFAALRQINFRNDFDFHDYLRRVYLQLHDAHTMYYAPTCYASWDFYQPFNLYGYVETTVNGAQVQRLAVSPYFEETVYAFYRDQRGINLADYIDAQVVSIQGRDAVQYMTQFAFSQVGSSKDAGVRYNIALSIPGPYGDAYYPHGQGAWLGLFSQRESHFLPPPPATEPSVSYQLRLANGTLVELEFLWIARSSVSYRSTQDLLQNYYFNSQASTSPTGPPSGEAADAAAYHAYPHRDQTTTRARVISFPRPASVQQQQEPQAADTVPIIPILTSAAGGAGAYQVGNRTLVLYLNTFEPENYFEFASVVADSSIYARMNGLDQLLIDLTGNGGGDICLGRSTLAFLFPGQHDWGPTDMPRSPCADNLTTTAINNNIRNTEWSPSFYQNEDNIQFPQNDPRWLIPGIPHVRGGLARNYSQLIHISEISEECGLIPFENLIPFSPSKMLIMTYGFCGSTCALFADHAHNYEGVRTVAVGGFPDVPQQYTSFPGLEVLETPSFYWILNSLLQESGDLNCKSCASPRNLITTAGYRMCIREIYGPKPAYPLEYTWQPADIRHNLSPSTAVHHQLLWPEMLQYF